MLKNRKSSHDQATIDEWLWILDYQLRTKEYRKDQTSQFIQLKHLIIEFDWPPNTYTQTSRAEMQGCISNSYSPPPTFLSFILPQIKCIMRGCAPQAKLFQTFFLLRSLIFCNFVRFKSIREKYQQLGKKYAFPPLISSPFYFFSLPTWYLAIL